MSTLLPFWQFERMDRPDVFRAIAVTAPDGRMTLVHDYARRPGNILYNLADEILRLREQEAIAEIGQTYTIDMSGEVPPESD